MNSRSSYRIPGLTRISIIYTLLVPPPPPFGFSNPPSYRAVAATTQLPAENLTTSDFHRQISCVEWRDARSPSPKGWKATATTTTTRMTTSFAASRFHKSASRFAGITYKLALLVCSFLFSTRFFPISTSHLHRSAPSAACSQPIFDPETFDSTEPPWNETRPEVSFAPTPFRWYFRTWWTNIPSYFTFFFGILDEEATVIFVAASFKSAVFFQDIKPKVEHYFVE